MLEIIAQPPAYAAILLGCLYLIWKGRPDWAVGIFVGLASWTVIIRIGAANHLWVFLFTIAGATVVHRLRHPRAHWLPRHDRGIVLWMVVWWGWMLLILGLNDGDPVTNYETFISLVVYNIIPVVALTLIGSDTKTPRNFAGAYVLTVVVGGLFALSRLSDMGYSPDILLQDPLLREYGRNIDHWFVYQLGILNYHQFASGFGWSIIFLLAFWQEKHRKLGYLILGLASAWCVYLLLLSDSKQVMVATLLVGLFFTIWALRRGSVLFRTRMLVLVGIIGALGITIFLARPDLVVRSSGSLGEALDISVQRLPFWEEGIQAFARSPLFGDGFAGTSSLGHNFFISTLANQGIVGMVFLLGFFTFFVRQIRGIWVGWGTRDQSVWRMAFFCVALSNLVSAQASGAVTSSWALFWSAAVLWWMREAINPHPSSQPAMASVAPVPRSMRPTL